MVVEDGGGAGAAGPGSSGRWWWHRCSNYHPHLETLDRCGSSPSPTTLLEVVLVVVGSYYVAGGGGGGTEGSYQNQLMDLGDGGAYVVVVQHLVMEDI